MTKRECKLVKKVSKLLKQANQREYLHRYGPKKYKFLHHAVALLLKESLKCSFRRISKILEMLDIKVPTYSALCKSRKRIPISLWNSLLKLTAGNHSGIVAIDGTGFANSNPSFHYIKRIDRRKPVKSFTKLSAIFDVIKKKFLALRVRTKPRHDIKDALPLVKEVKPKILLGDTAYDAESLHEHCFWKNIQTVIKPRRNVRRGWARKKQMKNYSEKQYHQRSLIESGFGSLKRKYGGSVSAKRSKSAKAEICLKAISHNLNLC